jgi:hypothetical protein
MSARTHHGLSTLASVELTPERQKTLDHMASRVQGSAVWRARKLAELRDLLALEQIAQRLHILGLQPATEFLVLVRLQVTVPCLGPQGQLVVEGSVDLALRYPEAILRGPLPGHALVGIPRPRNVWHPNVSADGAQRVCLGSNVPRGLSLREAVLGTYAALTLQSITLDRGDPAGVMNSRAIEFWNEHAARIPLSTDPFLGPCDGEVTP